MLILLNNFCKRTPRRCSALIPAASVALAGRPTALYRDATVRLKRRARGASCRFARKSAARLRAGTLSEPVGQGLLDCVQRRLRLDRLGAPGLRQIRAPQVHLLAANVHKDPVQVPSIKSHRAAFAYPAGIGWS